jgi:hypothetical protein
VLRGDVDSSIDTAARSASTKYQRDQKTIHPIPGAQQTALTMKLVQRQFLKGSREFEIADDVVKVRIKTLFKEEKLTVMLSMLNPVPAVNKPFLEFHGRVKSGPLISLLIDNPNAAAFNAFVNELRHRAREEYNAFAGLKSGSRAEGLAANVYEEPPDFDDPRKNRKGKTAKPIRVADIDISIQMLERHLDAEEIKPLLTALEALKTEPENESYFDQLVKAFDGLGSQQGAVLTYAPYVSILLSDNPLEY